MKIGLDLEWIKESFPAALGTWVLGGMFQGGIDENEAIATIHAALDFGVRLIDTAPLYGFGRTEQLVGKALKQYGCREQMILATKCGLSWREGKIFRDARKKTLLEEIDRSLLNLGVDWIDLYQLHWPDPLTPVFETAEALEIMLRKGKIRAVGLSNFSAEECAQFQEVLPIQSVQPPYNLFERMMGDSLLMQCQEKSILVLGYGTLCRGLLSGELKQNGPFRSDDLRSFDPKFQEPLFSQYTGCAERLSHWAKEKHGRSLLDLAFRWVLDRGALPLWGPQNRKELVDLKSFKTWKLSTEDFQEIDQIFVKSSLEPMGTEFLAPPNRTDP